MSGPGDADYWSEANLLAYSRLGLLESILATSKDWKQRKAARERGCPRGRIGLSLREGMERELLTRRGPGPLQEVSYPSEANVGTGEARPRVPMVQETRASGGVQQGGPHWDDP